MLSKRVEVAEDELEKAEAEVVATHEKVLAARRKARLARRLLRTLKKHEDSAYERELALIEEVERVEQGLELSILETPPLRSSQPFKDLLALGDLLNFPLDKGINTGTLNALPLV